MAGSAKKRSPFFLFISTTASSTSRSSFKPAYADGSESLGGLPRSVRICFAGLENGVGRPSPATGGTTVCSGGCCRTSYTCVAGAEKHAGFGISGRICGFTVSHPAGETAVLGSGSETVAGKRPSETSSSKLLGVGCGFSFLLSVSNGGSAVSAASSMSTTATSPSRWLGGRVWLPAPPPSGFLRLAPLPPATVSARRCRLMDGSCRVGLFPPAFVVAATASATFPLRFTTDSGAVSATAVCISVPLTICSAQAT